MAIHPDSNETVTVRWYWCEDDAKPFPAPHSFGTTQRMDPCDDPGGVGEVPNAKKTWYNGFNGSGFAGDKHCGVVQDFQIGVDLDAPVLVEKVPGIPLCCMPVKSRPRGQVKLLSGFTSNAPGRFTSKPTLQCRFTSFGGKSIGTSFKLRSGFTSESDTRAKSTFKLKAGFTSSSTAKSKSSLKMVAGYYSSFAVPVYASWFALRFRFDSESDNVTFQSRPVLRSGFTSETNSTGVAGRFVLKASFDSSFA